MTATLQPDDALIDALVRTARQVGVDRHAADSERLAHPIEQGERELMRAIVSAPAMQDWLRSILIAETPPLRFRYRNYRGEITARAVIPLGMRHGSTPWHHDPQWLLRAYDLEKGAEREFAINDINPHEGT